MTNNFLFEADTAAKKIYIEREFNAPVEKIWKAWTDPAILDQWWGPKPNKIETKVMDFKVGGMWQFAMCSPEGQQHWISAQFTGIQNHSQILTKALFFDGEGNTVDGPNWYRDTRFLAMGDNKTQVSIDITFEDDAIFERFTQGGYFKQGTAMGYDQLDELLESETVVN